MTATRRNSSEKKMKQKTQTVGADNGADEIEEQTTLSGTTASAEESSLDKHTGNTVEIGGKLFTKGRSAQIDKELDQLRSIVDAESGHAQILKQSLCICLIFSSIMMNLMMGTDAQPSLVGVQKCTVPYYSIQMTFVVICIVATRIAVKVNSGE